MRGGNGFPRDARRIYKGMQYFINCYQMSQTRRSPEYLIYRLYSGESEEEVKRRVMEDLVEEWQDSVDGIEEIDTQQDLRDFIHEIGSLISDATEDYDLQISDPYTNTSEAFDFYEGFVQQQALNDPNQEVDFYFYGDFLIKIQGIFPYLTDLHTSTGIHISSPVISRISGAIGLRP